MAQLLDRRGRIPLLAVLLATLVAGCSTPQLTPKQTVLPAEPVTFRIGLPGGFPAFAEDDRDPASSIFLLDTGAAVTIVTPRFAKRHGASIRSNSEYQMRDAIGNVRTPRLAHFDELHIRGATFRNIDVLVDDLTGLRGSMFDRVDALLGRSLFERLLLTVDYPGRRVVLERGELPPVDGRDVLPIIRARNGAILVPISVAGAQSWMILDTGHTVSGLHLLAERLAGLGWASPPIAGPTVQTMFGTSASQLGRVDRDVYIGRHALRRPIVCTVTSSDSEYIGSDVLAHFAVTIDQANDRIRFTRAETGPIDVPPLRTLGFSLDETATVTGVSPTSAAATSGLRIGDRIVAIERQPLKTMRHDAWQILENRGKPFRVGVVRDGETMELAVGVTTLVE